MRLIALKFGDLEFSTDELVSPMLSGVMKANYAVEARLGNTPYIAFNGLEPQRPEFKMKFDVQNVSRSQGGYTPFEKLMRLKWEVENKYPRNLIFGEWNMGDKFIIPEVRFRVVRTSREGIYLQIDLSVNFLSLE